MAIKARDYIAKLPVREQEAIKKEARKLILEEMSLSAIREARRHSQIELANKLGVQQPAVSKIEQQTDLYLSTLRNYIKAVGGKLEILAWFPDRDPIRITQFKPLTGHRKGRSTDIPVKVIPGPMIISPRLKESKTSVPPEESKTSVPPEEPKKGVPTKGPKKGSSGTRSPQDL